MIKQIKFRRSMYRALLTPVLPLLVITAITLFNLVYKNLWSSDNPYQEIFNQVDESQTTSHNREGYNLLLLETLKDYLMKIYSSYSYFITIMILLNAASELITLWNQCSYKTLRRSEDSSKSNLQTMREEVQLQPSFDLKSFSSANLTEIGIKMVLLVLLYTMLYILYTTVYTWASYITNAELSIHTRHDQVIQITNQGDLYSRIDPDLLVEILQPEFQEETRTKSRILDTREYPEVVDVISSLNQPNGFPLCVEGSNRSHIRL